MSPLFKRMVFTFERATEWSLLKTHAGAPDQPVRRDFPPPLPDMNTADVQGVPGVLLLVTKDDTVIYGYGWNRLVALVELGKKRAGLVGVEGFPVPSAISPI
ncbi:hypothetical protein V7S43_005533 [Phytophthora oleae]|uniref:Uncharacterized protein n=1 Tax=Phytophthora oleae TaxID=2107226 RepID=A0ABD3FS74_9STRA